MLRRFFLGIGPLNSERRLTHSTAFTSTIRRENLSLASCSSAELASVSVHDKIHNTKLYLQSVEKTSHLQLRRDNDVTQR
jgi:hypothetical protein